VHIGRHPADRSEGAIELRGRPRRHDVMLEQVGDQLEGMPGAPLRCPRDGSLGEQGDKGVRRPGQRAQEP
jgi:hypothetical protein